MGRVDKSAQVTKAVLAICSGEFTDYSNTAKKFHCSRIAVMRRITVQTKTRQDTHSFWHQCLTNDEEEILILRINTLMDRGLPPISQIIWNLAEEIRKLPVGKNWVSQFYKRHKLWLKSAYLYNIDNIRVSVEYAPIFILFFQLVCVLFRVVFVPTPRG